ncbi:MAG: phosphodiester glycosidase family protein [Allosphingosinicella sp.]
MRRRWRVAAALVVAALIAWIWLAPFRFDGPPPPAAMPARELVVAGHCEPRRFEGTDFTVCRYDAREHDLELTVDDAQGPLRRFARLQTQVGARAGSLLFAMNAGMYDDQGMPIGLYVERGRQRHRVNLNDGPGNFHMKPNGVFAVAADGRPSIVRSQDWRPGSARWATQSGPLLVIAGRLHPRFDANGSSLNIRNGVGIADANTAWFAISEAPVSFGRFARFFRDGLGCPDALFLDGTVSGLWDPAALRQDEGYPLGPLVAVFRKPSQPE